MFLDLRTIYVVTSITITLLGVLHCSAYFVGRFGRWQLSWGAGNILIGMGTFCIALRDFVPSFISVDVGNIVMWIGYMLMLTAVRAFAGRPMTNTAILLPIVSGALVFAFALNAGDSTSGRVIFGSLICCAVDVVIAREGWLIGRREGLRSAWILFGLYLTTALL